jgi:hypothetical protein
VRATSGRRTCIRSISCPAIAIVAITNLHYTCVLLCKT